MAEKPIEEYTEMELLEILVARVKAMPDVTAKEANIASTKAICGQAFATLHVHIKHLELLN